MPKIIKASIILLLSIISQGILLSSVAQPASKLNDDDSYNTEVKKLVGNKYKKVRAFKNEMAAVEQDGKWGFINKKGKEVVPVRYDLVTDFWDKQVTAVKQGAQWIIVNNKGEELKQLDIDFYGGFIGGKARVVKGGQQNWIDVRGEYLGSWTPIPKRKEWPGSTRLYPDGFRRNQVPCPENIDFEMNSFTNWVCQTGHTEYDAATNTNLLFLTNNTPPNQGLINHQQRLNYTNPPNRDYYGGFDLNSPDGSNVLVKLGNDNEEAIGLYSSSLCNNCPDARAEAIEYTVVVPNDAYDFNIMYDFAAVLDEPTNQHQFNEKPRFKLIVYNPLTNDTIACASADYVADNTVTSTNGFQQSPILPQTGSSDGVVWYRDWSTVFINLTKYPNQTLKLKFVTEDCTRGGHWGYAYLDVRQCQLAISAVNTCDVPSRTILTGPPGFQNYQWFDQNYNPLGTGITVNLPTALVVGDTVHLEITPTAGIVSGGLCKDTINTIVVNDTVLLDAGPDKTICARQQTTIGTSSTNSNYTFSWSPQSTVISPNTATTTVNPINTTQYYLTVTNQITRCQRIDSVIVNVRPIPTIQFPDTSICSGQSYQFSVSGADQYTWSPISGLVVNNSTGSNVTVTPTVTTTYAVSGSFNATGCAIDTAYRLVVDPLPQVSFTSPSAMCLRQNLFNFQSTSTISVGNITNYAWDFGDASGVINGNAVQHSYAAAQSYTVTHTVTSNKGCKKDISSVVTVNQEPDASASANGPTIFCQGDSVLLTGTFVNGSGTVNQTNWLYNQGFFGTQNTNPIRVYQPGNYQFVVTDNNNCKDTSSAISIFTNPLPRTQLRDTFHCFGKSTIISVSGADTYQWSPLASLVINNSSGSSVIASPLTNTTYTVTGIFASTGCRKDTTLSLTVYPLPIPDFSSPQALCFKNNIFTFTNTSTVPQGNIATSTWNFGDGSALVSGNPIQHSYGIAQVYNVKLITQSDRGCTDSTIKTIRVLKDPVASLSGPTSFCTGDSVSLTGNFINGDGQVNQTQWIHNQVSIGLTNTNPLIIHTGGQYQFAVMDNNNCKDTSSPLAVNVLPLPTSVPDLTPANATFLCNGSFIQLSAQASNASSFQWYFESLSNLGVLIPIVGATQSTYQTDSQGIYHVELSTNTSPVCKLRQSDTVRFTRYYKPSPSFNNPFVCAGQPVQFHNLSNISQSGPVIWQWNFGDNTPLVSIKNPIHTYTSGDYYNVTLKIIPQNCPQLDSLVVRQIEIFPTEPGIRYPDVHALLNTSTILQARELYNTSSLNWTPTHQLLNNPSSAQQIFRGNQQMDYTIQLISDKGCITYDKQRVLIFKESDIVVPDIFTPNNDSHNDKLDIFLVGMNKLTFFRVFNRWGQLLFETTDPSKQWDGRFQGKLQPTETYVWTAEGISTTGKKIYKRGQTILAQ